MSLLNASAETIVPNSHLESPVFDIDLRALNLKGVEGVGYACRFEHPATSLEDAARIFGRDGAVSLDPQSIVEVFGACGGKLKIALSDCVEGVRRLAAEKLGELWCSPIRDEIMVSKNFDAYNSTERRMRTVSYDMVKTYLPFLLDHQECLLPTVRHIVGDETVEVSRDPDEGTVINLQVFDEEAGPISRQEHGAHTDRVDLTTIICIDNVGHYGDFVYIKGYDAACRTLSLDPHRSFPTNMTRILAVNPKLVKFHIYPVAKGSVLLVRSDRDVHFITAKTKADVDSAIDGGYDPIMLDHRTIIGRGIINAAFETRHCREIFEKAKEIAGRYRNIASLRGDEHFAALDEALSMEITAGQLNIQDADVVRNAFVTSMSAAQLYQRDLDSLGPLVEIHQRDPNSKDDAGQNFMGRIQHPSSVRKYSYDNFLADFRSCDNSFFIEFEGNNIPNDDSLFANSHQKHCFKVYTASCQPELKILVIGRFANVIYAINRIHKVRVDVEPPVIDLDIWNNFSGECNDKITGLDLPMAESKEFGWSSKTNDSYMLGAIHNFIPFYLASLRIEKNVYDKTNRRLTTFARELLGLIRFGYGLLRHDKLGEVFVCVNKEIASKASLLDYEIEFKRVESLLKSDFEAERRAGVDYFTTLKSIEEPFQLPVLRDLSTVDELEPSVPSLPFKNMPPDWVDAKGNQVCKKVIDQDFDIIILTQSNYENGNEADWYVSQLLVEERLFLAALEARGLRAARVAWSNPEFSWSRTRAAVFRSTWDYCDRFGEFSSWMDCTAAKTRLFNSPELVRWNVDKHYLSDLAKCGLNVPATRYLERGETITLLEAFLACGWSEAVLKPIVSQTARHTYRVNLENLHAYETIFHTLLLEEGMMLQPFLSNVLTQGEVSMIVICGRCTHAVQKIPKYGDFRVQDDHGGQVHSHDVTIEEKSFAEKAVSVCPELPFYARVDAVRDDVGALSLMELEVVEPELFFRYCPAAADALAEAIVEVLQGA